MGLGKSWRVIGGIHQNPGGEARSAQDLFCNACFFKLTSVKSTSGIPRNPVGSGLYKNPGGKARSAHHLFLRRVFSKVHL